MQGVVQTAKPIRSVTPLATFVSQIVEKAIVPPTKSALWSQDCAIPKTAAPILPVPLVRPATTPPENVAEVRAETIVASKDVQNPSAAIAALANVRLTAVPVAVLRARSAIRQRGFAKRPPPARSKKAVLVEVTAVAVPVS